MKVLLVNGSPRTNGCTFTALSEVAKTLQEEGIETEIFSLGAKPVQDCVACGKCAQLKKCVFDDVVNELIEKAKGADGFVFGSPVYYAHPSGRVQSALDRAFYAGKYAFAGKPGAAVVSARRGGTAAPFDVLNKYFGISCMPVVSSTYWNMVFGPSPELAEQDKEGLQTMRNLARNLAWLLRCIAAGRERGIMPPAAEAQAWTSFNR